MTLPTEVNPLLRSTASTAYTINNSLRFRSSATAYLNRTFVAPTSATKWTWSGWVKRGILGNTQDFFTSPNISSTYGYIGFVSDQFYVANVVSGTLYGSTTSAVFRDPSSWYHIFVAVDTTQATASSRVLVYINGALQTLTTIGSGYIPQNTNTQLNSAVAHQLGAFTAISSYLDGYMAEVNFIDGQALTPSSFGAYSTNGVWQPARYTGTYGTNGFYLKFASFGTAAALGNDSSGNGNTWTVNNISVTAGTTYDPMLDSPTLTSATVANYPVMNPLAYRTVYSHTAPTNGNLTVSSADNYRYFTSTMASEGSYYFEINVTTNAASGNYIVIWPSSDPQSGTNITCGYASDGTVILNGATYTTVATYTTGDIVALAHNTSAGTVGVYKNGTLLATVTGVPTTGKLYPGCACGQSSVLNINFGQRAFSGVPANSGNPPSGFVALNAYNLATPTIANGSSGMGVTLYTGNGGNSYSIPHGLSFTPNLVWQKSRASASFGGNNHQIYDSVRGFGSGKELASNSTASEGNTGGATYGILSSVDSTYLNAALGTSGSQTWNQSGITYVVWNWLAGASSGSNTNGSITSTVSVNATAGFSVVTYTGTGANATVGHGLGVAPSMVIIKDRIQGSAAYHWFVYHISLGAGQRLLLNTTSAGGADTNYFNNTSPTSSVFSLGNATPQVNASGDTYVAYCWSAVAGYSAFGSYTGNGSTDGPFVYTGFRPRFIMVKGATNISDWYIWDSSRNAYNVAGNTLSPNTAGVEYSGGALLIDFLSNGFKLRDTVGSWNASGVTYIYAAFAENPFKYALAR